MSKKELNPWIGISVLALMAPGHAFSHPEVISRQLHGVYGALSCAADSEARDPPDGPEDDSLEAAALRLQKRLEKERSDLKKSLLKNKEDDPHHIEAALRFLAPAVLGDQFHQPIAEEQELASLSSVSNIRSVQGQAAKAYGQNDQGIDADGTSFFQGSYLLKDGSKTELAAAHGALLGTYEESLLDVILENPSCKNFTFDLEQASFTQKIFSTIEEARKFVENHELHAENLERCDGPFERKTSAKAPSVITESPQTLDCPDLQNYFQDNQWELEPEKLDLANQKTYRSKTCMEHVIASPGCADAKEREAFLQNLRSDGASKYQEARIKINECIAKLKVPGAKEVKILGVEIESSASRYRNTGVACNLSFAELSARRAASARDLVMRSLAENEFPTTAPVQVDSGGEWGAVLDRAAHSVGSGPASSDLEKLRGTSGPAPGKADKSEYEAYKYVKVRIRYTASVVIDPVPVEAAKYLSVCKSIPFVCGEEPVSSSSVKLRHKRGAYHSSGGSRSPRGGKRGKPRGKHQSCDAYN